MINRYSSRLSGLDESFLNKKLKGAAGYDRIAGYFCSSVLEVAGESIEAISGTVRVICNSTLSKEDIYTAVCAQSIKQEWCEFEPEIKYASATSKKRLELLYRLLKNKKLQIKVISNEVYGLMHGKAGVITYKDGRKTCFIGSINETKSAFKLNYEMVWEDDSAEAVEWVQNEFDFFWNSKYAVNLCDFVIEDINRLSKRVVVPIKEWKEQCCSKIEAAAVEERILRKEFGLWEHQKYFVELAFSEHNKEGGARLLLADQVGLGKTVQLAMSAKLMALCGSRPILIIVPKQIMFQWQDEIKSLLDMPSAVWTKRGWQDETGRLYADKQILRCPRRIGIVSQGLVNRLTEARSLLLQKEYECVILDEAHRARRRNPSKDPDNYKADANFLLKFLNEITYKTKSLLLATATPVQINTIEAYDLINALSRPTKKVMGDQYSEWHINPQTMLNIVCEKTSAPQDEISMWNIMRNPFPAKAQNTPKINMLRNDLDIDDNTYVLKAEMFDKSRLPIKNKIRELYGSGNFILKYNPYIRHIVRRTRKFLEENINPLTQKTYLKKINVKLLGENDEDAILLDGYLLQAYEKAQEFCRLLSKRVKAGGFMSTLMLKRIGSTIIAGQKTANKMLDWVDEGRQKLNEELDNDFEDNEDNEENEENEDCSEASSEVKQLTSEEIEVLKELITLLELNKERDPKFKRVLSILLEGADKTDKPWREAGCIIFSQYYDSAQYVAEKLSAHIADTPIGLYAGGSDKSGCFINGRFEKRSREDIKASVKNRQIKILVGTDAASEGLNLQTLSTLINLDLPWNPTRLEQRKGRIQRIGQMSDTVCIFNMRYKDSVEDKVHKVLSSRLNDIYSMFGQIPDTLEDVWINVALNNIEKAKERIDALPKQNPFCMKYELTPPQTKNWEACEIVLDNQDKIKLLMQGWQ